MSWCYHLDAYTLHVPFSCCRYRYLFATTFSLTCKYHFQPVDNQFALPFSLHRTFKRFIQHFKCFSRPYKYSETFPCTFVTLVHIQYLPSLRDADTIAANGLLSEQFFCHLERTVFDKYVLSYHTVIYIGFFWGFFLQKNHILLPFQTISKTYLSKSYLFLWPPLADQQCNQRFYLLLKMWPLCDICQVLPYMCSVNVALLWSRAEIL